MRDLWLRKGSLGALSFVCTIGVAFLVSMFGVYYDLRDARDRFYTDYALADFHIQVKAAPENVLARLSTLPGVGRLEGGVQLEGRTEVPGFLDPVQTTLVGIPRGGKVFNRLLPLAGGEVQELETGEAYTSAAFYEAHELRPGDTLAITLLGQQERIRIAGAVQSPEWVYVLAPGGGLAPDPLRTAVLFLPIRQLQQAGELENSYNILMGRFSEDVRGYPEREHLVLERLEEELSTYGVINASPRSQFLSVQFLESDILGLKVSASIMPTLCLLIVAVVLNVVIGRLVAGQRTVVGTLKALGYPSPAITFHYLGFGIAVGLIGAALGSTLGLWLQRGLLSLYRTIYELPIKEPGFYPELIGVSVGLSLLFAILGTGFGVRTATRLSPAVAMRPPPPEKGGRILLERGLFKYLWRLLPFTLKLILRAIFRNPFRSFVTFGSSFIATTIMVESLATGSAIQVLIDREFRTAQKQDVTVLLREARDTISVTREFQTLPGVERVECHLNSPARLSALNGSGAQREVLLSGLAPDPILENPLRLTPAIAEGFDNSGEGLYLARKLGEVLQVDRGARLEVELRSGSRRTYEVPVAGLVDTSLGLGAYLPARELSRLMGETAVTNKILLLVAPDRRDALVAELRRRPEVLNVTWRNDSLQQMEQTLQQNLGTMLSVIIVFSGGLAFGAVLNTALVALSEREREVGTLRVLGYTPMAVTSIFSGESLLLNSLGVSVGWAGGAALTYFVTRAYDTEIFRFPFAMEPQNFVVATLVMMVFLAASQAALYVFVRGLNWLDVLKIRE
ncbi:MAG: FtsX-like permease family protein [Vulcanimicrobiota bacterium]